MSSMLKADLTAIIVLLLDRYNVLDVKQISVILKEYGFTLSKNNPMYLFSLMKIYHHFFVFQKLEHQNGRIIISLSKIAKNFILFSNKSTFIAKKMEECLKGFRPNTRNPKSAFYERKYVELSHIVPAGIGEGFTGGCGVGP
jgi:hypothetical protein